VLKDDNLPETNCARCVQGKGDVLITVDPITGASSESDLPVLKLPTGINPTSFVFTMAGRCSLSTGCPRVDRALCQRLRTFLELLISAFNFTRHISFARHFLFTRHYILVSISVLFQVGSGRRR